MATVDIAGGFGGFAREFLTYVREECPKAPLVVFGASAARTLRDSAVVAPVHSIASVGSSVMCVEVALWWLWLMLLPPLTAPPTTPTPKAPSSCPVRGRKFVS